MRVRACMCVCVCTCGSSENIFSLGVHIISLHSNTIISDKTKEEL